MLIFALLLAQAAAPDSALYNRARAYMADILANQPNYTCLETIDRSEQGKAKAKFEVIDSLRFEVAFVDKRELYAWPGAKKFDDTSILDMVPEGAAIATGAFAGHAQYLFQSNIATVKAGEWAEEGGTRYARYPFTVPAERSRYMLMKSKKESAAVGYSGEIWIEPLTARVSRISLHAEDIPAKLEIRKTATLIEYGAAKIGSREFWLPSRSVEEITASSGRTDRNITRFSGCRAFLGESRLRFDEVPAEDPAAAAVPIKTIDLPPGLWFELQFDEGVSSQKSVVGDLIPATLSSDIKHKGMVLFPKGSELELRLVRIQHMRDAISLEFSLGDVKSKTAVALMRAIPDPTIKPRGTIAPGVPQSYGDAARPGLGTYFIRGDRMTLRKGYRSAWVTTPERPSDKQN